MKFSNPFKHQTGKKYFILGAARSGVSAARLLRKHGVPVFVSEMKLLTNDTRVLLQNEEIDFEESGHNSDNIKNYDVMVISPGIGLSSSIVMQAQHENVEIISEIELALQFINPKTRLIGITGTNGKSTTTHYLAHLLNMGQLQAAACGNIGVPLSEVILLNNEYDALSIELSSYQLELGVSKRFDAAILLNLQNDHLARHKTYENYLCAKWNLILSTKDDGICIIDASVLKMAQEFKFFMPKCQIKDTKNQQFHIDHPCLPGAHNETNIYAATLAALHVGVSQDTILNEWNKHTSHYQPLAHRLESVSDGKISERIFINDSKATNVESTLVALKALKQPIHLLLGGEPKGDSYQPISEFFGKNVLRVYPFGKSASLIQNEFSNFGQFLESSSCDMISAAQKAFEKSQPGEIILLSPACSSFDEFRNFEHRGDVFKSWVKGLCL